MANIDANGFIGKGDVLFNVYDPDEGRFVGWVEAGNAIKFEIKPNSEIKEMELRGLSTYGQVGETVAMTKPADLSITLTKASRENLTLAFMGTQVAINQAAGTVSDEAVTLRVGGGVQLSKKNLSATGFVLEPAAAGTPYVLDTDYTVTWRLGMVFVVPGSALDVAVKAAGTTGLAVLATFTHNAYTGARIKGATQPQLRCQVKLNGANMVDDRPVICEVFEAILTPDAGFDFLAEDWVEVPLKGRMKTPTGKTEPFTVEFLD